MAKDHYAMKIWFSIGNIYFFFKTYFLQPSCSAFFYFKNHTYCNFFFHSMYFDRFNLKYYISFHSTDITALKLYCMPIKALSVVRKYWTSVKRQFIFFCLKKLRSDLDYCALNLFFRGVWPMHHSSRIRASQKLR